MGYKGKKVSSWAGMMAVYFLVFTLMSTITAIPVRAEESNTWKGEGFEVTFMVDSQWQGAFNGRILIRNTGSRKIENWCLQFPMNYEIINIWDAVIAEKGQGSYLVKNAGWNPDIAVGGSVSFGFGARAEGKITFPDTYSMQVREAEVVGTDFIADFKVSSDWKDGFTAAVSIKNNKAEAIEDWVLEFDFSGGITTIWNAVMESHVGDHYIIKNAGHNRTINIDKPVSFGFQGVWGTTGKEPVNYVLREKQAGSGGTDSGEETEKPALADIGEAYFKKASIGDIQMAGDGIQYVENQLNIVAVEEASYGDIEKLSGKYGFRIVGYIELSNDFQVEFLEDKTYGELLEAAEKLEELKQVEAVNANMASETGSDYYPDDAEWPNGGGSEDIWDKDPEGINWGVEAIRAPEAWNERGNMKSVKIGLIDQGFDTRHEDLKFAHVWNNPDDSLIKEQPRIADHGTHVAGTMAAEFDNKKGVSGIAVKKTLYAYAMPEVREIASDGNVLKYNYDTTMECKYALALLVGNGVRVINISMGYGGVVGFAASMKNKKALKFVKEDSKMMGSFLARLLGKGYDFLIVTSAGNNSDTKFIVDGNTSYGYSIADENDPMGKTYKMDASYNNKWTSITVPSVKDRILVVGSIGLKDRQGNLGYRYSPFSNVGSRVDIVAPGEVIYSTLSNNRYGNSVKYEGIWENETKIFSGTSMAAPHISGIAALILSVNPRLSAKQACKLVKESSKKIGITDGIKIIHPLPDASAAVEMAKITKGELSTTSLPVPKTFVFGFITPPIGETTPGSITVQITDLRTKQLRPETCGVEKQSGGFEMFLEPGNYNIEINAPGYLSVLFKNNEVKQREAVDLGAIRLTYPNHRYTVIGKIEDSTRKGGIEGAELTFRNNINVKTGRTELKLKTEKDGTYEMELPSGYYTVEVKKQGYITEHITVSATEVSQMLRQNAVLTPESKENEYRAVLTWEDKPEDLDLHLTGPDGKKRYHVYYLNQEYSESGNTLAKLDRDAAEGLGPETITFTTAEQGIYYIMVYDYSNHDNNKSKECSLSGAKVRLYKGKKLLLTYHVPENKKGNLWSVLEIKDGEVKKIRSLEYRPDWEHLE